jgi:hypothetical protein
MRGRAGVGVERGSAAENRVRCPGGSENARLARFTPAARVAWVNFLFEPEGRQQLSELLAKASPNLMRPYQ